MIGAGNEDRTRDLNLGKVALYQLSYSRVVWRYSKHGRLPVNPLLQLFGLAPSKGQAAIR